MYEALEEDLLKSDHTFHHALPRVARAKLYTSSLEQQLTVGVSKHR